MKVFLYGSFSSHRPARYHLSDTDGKVFCGANGPYMEQFNEILFNQRIAGTNELVTLHLIGKGTLRSHLPTVLWDWHKNKCLKCEAAYKKLLSNL